MKRGREITATLTGAGIYRIVREVLTLDGYYNMATECVSCPVCLKRFVCWSLPILDQLDEAHRQLFPAILTYK